MNIFFLIFAALTIAGTAAAMSLRSAIHCILALTIGLVGLAVLYLLLGAQFVGFTQILVYVGAVAILAVFAIMMTQGAKAPALPVVSSSWISGSAVALGVFALLAWAIHSAGFATPLSAPQPEASVNQIGDALMHRFVLPLEIIGLLLTVALVGAVIVAMPEKKEPR